MNFTVPDAIMAVVFTGVITGMGFIFKYFINKLNKNNDEKENRIFNELSKLTLKMEETYKMIMELKVDIPKSYASKEDLHMWTNKEERTHRDIHDRIDKLYDERK